MPEGPLKSFMSKQLQKLMHENYYESMNDYLKGVFGAIALVQEVVMDMFGLQVQ